MPRAFVPPLDRPGFDSNHSVSDGIGWRRVLERARVQNRPIGQTRYTYAVMMLQRGAPLAWLQRQMGHTTLQMLIRHYWRYMQAHDLRTEEMARLEHAAGPTVRETLAKLLI
jgi:integrase